MHMPMLQPGGAALASLATRRWIKAADERGFFSPILSISVTRPGGSRWVPASPRTRRVNPARPSRR